MSEHELWNELGNLYFLSGSYDQAANAYRRSIQLDTGFGRPYSNLALTYVQQGKFDDAIDLYRRSIDLLTEKQEKAVSWNRLGTVYRHLKDYSKAVVAFQEADELDPENAAEFPTSINTSDQSPQTPSSVLDGPTMDSGSPEAEPEWWDVDEKRVEVATQMDAIDMRPEDAGQSWTAADTTQFQQDMSEMPTASSLTTWADREMEEEFETLSPLDAEPDIDLAGLEEDVSTWLPIPEEAPWMEEEVQAAPFLDEIVPEPPDPEPDWNRTEPYVVETVDFAPLVPMEQCAPPILDFSQRPETIANEQTATQPAWEPKAVDVVVLERPSPEFSLPVQEVSQLTEMEPISHEIQTEPAPAPVYEAASQTETPTFERPQDELHEIEMGIAKFKRVVQLNPRNGHAWDALGTLYKSAGLYKDAILAYQQAISNDCSKSLYYHHLGLVYACEGRDEDAIGAFQRVLEIDPDYSLAHATLGGYYRKMGLEELAQKHIGKAMKNIFDSENEYNRACLEAICGNADQAIELLGVALKNKQTYVDWILRDPDLDFIRQDPRFKQLISDFTR